MSALEIHIRQLLVWLLHYRQKSEIIDEVIATIQILIDKKVESEKKKGKAIKAKENYFSGGMLCTALNRIIGKCNWDIALLIATTLDPCVAPSLHVTLTHLKLKILTDPDEKLIALTVFTTSDLQSLLMTRDRKQDHLITARDDIITARAEFLIDFINVLTENLLFSRRRDFFNIARSKAGVAPASFPYQGDDAFSEAYIKLRENNQRIFPENYSSYTVRIISTRIIDALNKGNKVLLSPN